MNIKTINEKIYKKILEIDPENANAKHSSRFMGVMFPFKIMKIMLSIFNKTENFNRECWYQLGYEAPNF